MNIYKDIYDGNAIANLDPKRMSSMNSLIPSLARVSLGTSYIGRTHQFLKKRTSDHKQMSGFVSRPRRGTKCTRKMTHSRCTFPPTVLTV